MKCARRHTCARPPHDGKVLLTVRHRCESLLARGGVAVVAIHCMYIEVSAH